MILYHFTNRSALDGPDGILAAGIGAKDASDLYPMMASKLRPCVWLTSEIQPSILFAREARLTVELSSASKRLVSWPKWLQKHRGEVDGVIRTWREWFEELERDKSIGVELGREPTPSECRAWREWWIHFGDIPPKAVRAVDYLEDTR